jgi:hypothetical protein
MSTAQLLNWTTFTTNRCHCHTQFIRYTKIEPQLDTQMCTVHLMFDSTANSSHSVLCNSHFQIFVINKIPFLLFILFTHSER